ADGGAECVAARRGIRVARRRRRRPRPDHRPAERRHGPRLAGRRGSGRLGAARARGGRRPARPGAALGGVGAARPGGRVRPGPGRRAHRWPARRDRRVRAEPGAGPACGCLDRRAPAGRCRPAGDRPRFHRRPGGPADTGRAVRGAQLRRRADRDPARSLRARDGDRAGAQHRRAGRGRSLGRDGHRLVLTGRAAGDGRRPGHGRRSRADPPPPGAPGGRRSAYL
ncbi:MAG: hypothetical protein AVDCRST_MAG57-1536, partial [uncultured Blastococcus sp.]